MTLQQIRADGIQYSINGTKILHDVSVHGKQGKISGFLGPNGSGKSITNRLLAMLDQPDQGEILWDGVDVSTFSQGKDLLRQRRRIGLVWQTQTFLSRSLAKNMELPLEIRGIPKEQRKTMVSKGLKEFRLSKYADKSPAALSIGMQQRAGVLRATITDPEVLILDEPSASLDHANTKWLEEFVGNYVQEHPCIIFLTTHDQFQAKRMADHIFVFIDGRVMANDHVDQIWDHQDISQVRRYLAGELI